MGQIEEDQNYNFQSKYDEDHDIYDVNAHSCKYHDISEFNPIQVGAPPPYGPTDFDFEF